MPKRSGTVAAASPRSKPSSVMATAQPLFTPPTTFSFGQTASVKNTSLNSESPEIILIGRTSTPGWRMSTSRNVMPLCLGASGSVRTSRKMWSARCPADVQIFWPLITHWSPSSTARQPRLPRSEPAFGSE